MIAFRQLDAKLLPAIQHAGCAMLSLLYCDHESWSQSQVNELYKAATFAPIDKERTVMREDCFINSWPGLLRLAGMSADLMELHAELFQPVPEKGFSIGRWYNAKTDFTHFVVLDDSVRIIWDSLGESITVRDGRGKDKLIFRWRI